MKKPIHGGNIAWAAAIANCPASAILDFSASINPLGPPKSAIASISQGISQLSHYPDPDYAQFCTSISSHHNIDYSFVLPGNGAAELLTWAGWELSQLDITLIPNPGFADYRRALQTFSASIKPYNLNLLPEDLKTNQKAGLIINNPHNPTGKLWQVAEILPLLEKFALVVIDEAFMDFLPPSQQESLIAFVPEYDNLIILRSLTKFYSLPGLRLGYAITHSDRVKKWQKWRDPWTVNTLAALAGAAVLKDREFQQQTWDWLIPTRENLWEDLGLIPYLQPQPSSANFFLVETAKPSAQLQLELLKKEQILIRDCLSFPLLGDRFFRIAIRTEQENQTLVNALKRINN